MSRHWLFCQGYSLPHGFCIHGGHIFTIRERRTATKFVALTFSIFALVSAPLFVAISRIAGRPTFSEAGRLNYSWNVNQVDWDPLHNSVSLPPSAFAHPMQIIHRHPNVIGFQKPDASTYPPWDDPFYWAPRNVDRLFNPLQQWNTMNRYLIQFAVNRNMAPLWGLGLWSCLLFFIRPKCTRDMHVLQRSSILLMPGIVALLIYSLVAIEPRYVGPFVVLIFLGLLPWIFFDSSISMLKRDAIVTQFFVAFMIVLVLAPAARVALHPVSLEDGPLHYRAAESLLSAGMLPDDALAVIDGPDTDGVIWSARLARLRVVGEMPTEEADDFWRSSDPNL